jgi:hypothetical protein
MQELLDIALHNVFFHWRIALDLLPDAIFTLYLQPSQARFLERVGVDVSSNLSVYLAK